MIRLFCCGTKMLKHSLNNELALCWIGNFFSISSHRPSVVQTPPYSVNQFSTCQCLLRDTLENIENFNSSKMIIKKDGTVKKKKKPVGVRIYLLNDSGISSSLFLEDAEKLAKRQGLELKKVEDINGTPAYRLVQFSDLLENEVSSIKDDKKNKMKVKKLFINSDISLHDLQIKIKQINKFLDKGMKVYIKLGDKSSDSSKVNNIVGELEKSLASYSVSKFVSVSGCYVDIMPQKKNADKDKAK